MRLGLTSGVISHMMFVEIIVSGLMCMFQIRRSVRFVEMMFMLPSCQF